MLFSPPVKKLLSVFVRLVIMQVSTGLPLDIKITSISAVTNVPVALSLPNI